MAILDSPLSCFRKVFTVYTPFVTVSVCAWCSLRKTALAVAVRRAVPKATTASEISRRSAMRLRVRLIGDLKTIPSVMLWCMPAGVCNSMHMIMCGSGDISPRLRIVLCIKKSFYPAKMEKKKTHHSHLWQKRIPSLDLG